MIMGSLMAKKTTQKVKKVSKYRRGQHPNNRAVQIKPGQVLNPKGRPKGARSRFGEQFMQDFLADWEEHGKDALIRVRATDPSTYLRVAASLLPKELNITEGKASLDRMMENLDDAELDKLISGLITLGNNAGAGKKATAEAALGKISNRVH
jgi:hypothetical protein